LLSAVRADWFHQHNELIVIVEQLKKDNEDLAKLAQEKTERLEEIRVLCDVDDDPGTGEGLAIKKILELLDK